MGLGGVASRSKARTGEGEFGESQGPDESDAGSATSGRSEVVGIEVIGADLPEMRAPSSAPMPRERLMRDLRLARSTGSATT